MAGRILVIRGGAIGDFILTLPALRLLREGFPDASIEILGYKHIIALAHDRFYARQTRSIEYGPMAGFFSRNGELDQELQDYFAGFDQIISYLFDPDRIFETNLRRSGVKNLLNGHAPLHDSLHATFQLAAPLQQLALFLDDPAAKVFPSDADHVAAADFLGPDPAPFFSLHPGSGSKTKNWPAGRWREIVGWMLRDRPAHKVLLVGGEADGEALASLRTSLPPERVQIAEGLPLTTLAAVLARADFHLGHDSGISHLSAATGVPGLLLFGPTDPEVWAPTQPGIRVLRAPDHKMESITTDELSAALSEHFQQPN